MARVSLRSSFVYFHCGRWCGGEDGVFLIVSHRRINIDDLPPAFRQRNVSGSRMTPVSCCFYLSSQTPSPCLSLSLSVSLCVSLSLSLCLCLSLSLSLSLSQNIYATLIPKLCPLYLMQHNTRLYNCTSLVSWCRVRSSHIHAHHETSLNYNNSERHRRQTGNVV